MKSLKQELGLSALQILFFVLFVSVIAYIAGCSRIRIPGADDITSIKVEACYKTNFCINGEGKTLDEVADNLELQYKAVQEENQEEPDPNAS